MFMWCIFFILVVCLVVFVCVLGGLVVLLDIFVCVEFDMLLCWDIDILLIYVVVKYVGLIDNL